MKLRSIGTAIIVLFLGVIISRPVSAQMDGATLGGYGELHYNDVVSEKDTPGTLDFHRFILFAGYQFNDWISFFSETEIEHTLLEPAEGEGGELALEQAYLDMRLKPELGIRAGIILVPSGIINPTHEPPTFNGVERPHVAKYIIPSTWRESGVGVYGKFKSGWSYEAYLMAGLDASEINGSEGIREARQQGFRSSTDNLSVTGRLDYRLNLNWQFGTSFYYSNLETDALYGNSLSGAKYGLFEVHSLYSNKAFEARGLLAYSTISNADKLNRVFGNGAASAQYGGYIELSYNIMTFISPGTTQELDLFGRYESFDTNYDPAAGLNHVAAYNRNEYTFGLTYSPDSQVAVKMDYQILNDAAPGNDINMLNLGIGYNF